MIRQKIILDKRGILNKKVITIILVVLTVAATFILIFVKFNINKHLKLLPDFGEQEDEKIGGVNKKSGFCCCLYEEGTLNKGNCIFQEGKRGELCNDILGPGWARVSSAFCFSEQICQYGYDDDKDGKIDCQDEDCDGKFCGSGKICINKECKDVGGDEYADYVFYIKINEEDVTNEEKISLSAGKEYKISFGYELEGEKAEGIDMYYLQIKDESGKVVEGEQEDVFRTGKGDEESFSWTAELGVFTFRAAFSKEDDFYPNHIIKIIEKKVYVK